MHKNLHNKTRDKLLPSVNCTVVIILELVNLHQLVYPVSSVIYFHNISPMDWNGEGHLSIVSFKRGFGSAWNWPETGDTTYIAIMESRFCAGMLDEPNSRGINQM